MMRRIGRAFNRPRISKSNSREICTTTTHFPTNEANNDAMIRGVAAGPQMDCQAQEILVGAT